MEISVRRAEPSDYEAIAKIFTGTKAVWGTLQLPFPSVESWRKKLAEPTEGLVSLVACADGQVVGTLGLHVLSGTPRRRHVASIGMAVGDEWQGKGIGTALMRAGIDLADGWLNLVRLELDVYTDNAPAIRLYQKFGFQVEGTCRCSAFRAGEYVDTFIMARLRPPRV
jgi:putative acetyltransferase